MTTCSRLLTAQHVLSRLSAHLTVRCCVYVRSVLASECFTRTAVLFVKYNIPHVS